MTNHHEEEKTDDYVYYLVGLISGLFVGAVMEDGFIWIPILGVFGLLFTAFFLSVFVKGREGA